MLTVVDNLEFLQIIEVTHIKEGIEYGPDM